MSIKTPPNYLATLALLLAPSAHGALSFSNTDVSWAGDVADPGAPATALYTFPDPAIVNTYIENTSSGTISIASFDSSTNQNPANRISSTLSADISFTFTGGTGDIRLVNSTDSENGGLFYNSFSITGLAGVTSLNVKVEYNEFVAGRSQIIGGGMANNLRGLSTLAAIGANNLGGGLTPADITSTLTFGQAFGLNPGGGYSAGVPSGTAFVANGGGLGSTPSVNGSDVTFTSSGLSGLVPGIGLSDHFLFLRAFNTDGSTEAMSGDPTLTAADGEGFYARSLEFDLNAPGSGFDATTQITLSLDGQQYPGFENVPEPSSLMTLALGLLGFLTVRRR